MPVARRSLFLILFLVTFGVCPLAQTGDTRKDLPSRLRHPGKIFSSYDRFEDITMLAVDWMLVAGTKYNGLSIQFIAGTKGKTFTAPPPIVGVGILALTSNPAEAKDSRLYALVNGEPVVLGEMKLSSRTNEHPLYSVSYSLLLPYDKVSRIAAAEKVEVRFDGIEFELTDDHRNALLDLLAYARGQ